MSMTFSEKNEYNKCISNGEWHISYAENYERNHYFSDAKGHYFRAMECFKQAYQIAREADDYLQNEADSKYRNAEKNFHDIG